MVVPGAGAAQKSGRRRLREGAEFGRAIAVRSGDGDGEDGAHREQDEQDAHERSSCGSCRHPVLQINKYSCLSLQTGPDKGAGKGDHDDTGPARDHICPSGVRVFAHEERRLTRRSMNESTNGSRIPFATCETRITCSSGRCGMRTKTAPKTIRAV